MAKPQLVCCQKCRKPVLQKNFYAHLRNVHHFHEEDVNRIKRDITRARLAANPEVHITCPLCREPFDNVEQLACHCLEKHTGEDAVNANQDYRMIRVEFESKRDFDSWIDEQQQRTATVFITRRSWKNGKYLHLRCSRAGKYVRKTVSRHTRTTKDVVHCSCFMNVCVNEDGTVRAKGCLGHIGHKVEPALLRLTHSQQLYLKELLKDFSPDYILNLLQKDHPAETSRLHFVTKGDLYRIMGRFGMRQGSRHQDDMLSLRARLEENNIDVVSRERAQLRSSITRKTSMVLANVNILVNSDTEVAMSQLREIHELVDKASKIRFGSSSGLVGRPELAKPGRKPRQPKRKKRGSTNVEHC